MTKKLKDKEFAIHFAGVWHRRVLDPAKTPLVSLVPDVTMIPEVFQAKVKCGKTEEAGPTAVGPLSLGAPYCGAGCW